MGLGTDMDVVMMLSPKQEDGAMDTVLQARRELYNSRRWLNATIVLRHTRGILYNRFETNVLQNK